MVIKEQSLGKVMRKAIVSLIVMSTVFVSVSCSYDATKSGGVKDIQKTLLKAEASEEDLDFPSHNPSILRGKEVYKKNCASCHGSTPSKHLSRKKLRAGTPEEQYLVVTKGNLHGMPGFRKQLTRDQRWDALLYIRSNILGYLEEGGAEYQRISAIFGGNCAVCHGTRGHGDGPLHYSLVPPPANFNQFERLYTRTDDILFERVSHGIPWTAMPAWKDRVDFDKNYSFDDELRWKLVRYVRQFGFSQGLDRLDRGRENLEVQRKKIEEFRKKAGVS